MNQQVLQAKKETVAKITKDLQSAGSLTVVSYQGLTVAEMQELRKALEGAKATITIYKNTMVRRALEDAKKPELGDLLNGPNAFVFSEEIGAGPKALAKFARTHEHLVLKGGLAEDRVFDEAGIKALGKMPDRNGLLSMFISCLNAPITKFAATVKAIADKQSPAAAEAAAN